MKQDTDIQAKQQGEIILYQPDETVRLEVRLEDDTVWLNQAQMGELFGTNRQAITKHLQNIYDCEELKKESTSSILELVRREGNRNVRRKIEFYNLDAIISVGFRVNTKRGIEFRQWANRVLKEYLLRGHVVNSRIMALEQRVEEQGSLLKEVQQKIDFFRPHLAAARRGHLLRRPDIRCLRPGRRPHQAGQAQHRAHRQLHRRDDAHHAQQAR